MADREQPPCVWEWVLFTVGVLAAVSLLLGGVALAAEPPPRYTVVNKTAPAPGFTVTNRMPTGPTMTGVIRQPTGYTVPPVVHFQRVGDGPWEVVPTVGDPYVAPAVVYTLPSVTYGGCVGGNCAAPAQTGWYLGKRLGR